MLPWHIVGAGVLSVAAVAGIYAVGYRAGHNGATATEAAQERLLRELADEVDARTAARVAAIRVVNRTINGQVREIVRENTVYRDCVLDPGTISVLDAARRGEAPAPAR